VAHERMVSVLVADLESWTVPTVAKEGELRDLVARRMSDVLVGDPEWRAYQVLCEGTDLRDGLRQIVPMHIFGGSFWPDITVIGRDASEPIMAVEVKLPTGTNPGPIATAIGQALCYRHGKPYVGSGRKRACEGTPYPWVVTFIVDRRRDSSITMERTPLEDQRFREWLWGQQIALVVRDERSTMALNPYP